MSDSRKVSSSIQSYYWQPLCATQDMLSNCPPDPSWPLNWTVTVSSLVWFINNEIWCFHGSGWSESGLVCCDTVQFCSLLQEYMTNMAVHCVESKFGRCTPITSLWAVNNNCKCKTIEGLIRCTVEQRRTADWNVKNFNAPSAFFLY